MNNEERLFGPGVKVIRVSGAEAAKNVALRIIQDPGSIDSLPRSIGPIFPLDFHLPKEQFVPAIRSIIDGTAIDWSKPTVIADAIRTAKSKKFLHAIASMADCPGEESEEAFKIMADDLEQFSPNLTLLKSERLKEWYSKLFILGKNLYGGLTISDKNNLSQEAQRFIKIVERQFDELSKTLLRLGINDLEAFIRFEDCNFQNADNAIYIKVPLRGDILEEANSVEDDLMRKTRDAAREAWDSLRYDWNWQQIREVLQLLPQLQDNEVIAHAIEALENNLSNYPQKSTEVQLDPAGIAYLVINGKEINREILTGDFSGDYVTLLEQLEAELELEGFSIPRKYLPSTAINLLSQLSDILPEDRFLEILKSIHNLLTQEKKSATPWTLTLIAVAKGKQSLSSQIEKLIEDLSLIEPVKKTLLSQQSGRVWYVPNEDKLRYTQGNSQLLHAFPVFISKAAENDSQENRPEEQPKSQTEKLETKIIKTEETSDLPLFGKVGVAGTQSVSELITVLFNNTSQENQNVLDEDILLADFEKLQKESSFLKTQRTALYHHTLNRNDPYLRLARQLGIEAVYLDKNKVIFILERRVAACKEGDNQIAVKAEIDAAGQLHIPGMEDKFVGDARHIFLNNFALHLAAKPLLFKSGLIDESDKEFVKLANQAASDWNRSTSRDHLGKIGLRGSNSRTIVIEIPGHRDPIFVGEMSK